ncbi:hypothetical protein B0I35DRAFT_2990 [Stachybotrys elegans]|uniref:Uncharacterized protein n=1 Tax=Stachybotrys elegans TaxID=80388 RepID=A0A8K0WWW8_9HYPO|nr:hypothetical protein B0I35DRAFT_2990 [Stachybotrys elegans]
MTTWPNRPINIRHNLLIILFLSRPPYLPITPLPSSSVTKNSGEHVNSSNSPKVRPPSASDLSPLTSNLAFHFSRAEAAILSNQTSATTTAACIRLPLASLSPTSTNLDAPAAAPSFVLGSRGHYARYSRIDLWRGKATIREGCRRTNYQKETRSTTQASLVPWQGSDRSDPNFQDRIRDTDL